MIKTKYVSLVRNDYLRDSSFLFGFWKTSISNSQMSRYKRKKTATMFVLSDWTHIADLLEFQLLQSSALEKIKRKKEEKKALL